MTDGAPILIQTNTLKERGDQLVNLYPSQQTKLAHLLYRRNIIKENKEVSNVLTAFLSSPTHDTIEHEGPAQKATKLVISRRNVRKDKLTQ